MKMPQVQALYHTHTVYKFNALSSAIPELHYIKLYSSQSRGSFYIICIADINWCSEIATHDGYNTKIWQAYVSQTLTIIYLHKHAGS